MKQREMPDCPENPVRSERQNRVAQLAVPVVLTVVSAICFLFLILRAVQSPDYSWTDYTYISHAMGAVDDSIHYTNTAEAFRINYDKGYRVFEVDLEYTSDGKIVCLHGWSRSFFKKHLGIKRKKRFNNVPMTYDEFMSLTFHDKYPASDFPMICEVLKEHPDAWLVLDGKVADPELVRAQYSELYQNLMEICPDAVSHIIPQIYTREMLDVIREIYPWHSVIYTLYQLEEADAAIREDEEAGQTAEETEDSEKQQKVRSAAAMDDTARKIVEAEGFDPMRELEFAAGHDIGELTISYELWKAHPDLVPAAHKKGIKVFVHTVDSGKKWARLQKAHVDGIYTNWRLD